MALNLCLELGVAIFPKLGGHDGFDLNVCECLGPDAVMACVVYGAFEVASKQAFCDWILEKSANVALGEPLSATLSKALRVEGAATALRLGVTA